MDQIKEPSDCSRAAVEGSPASPDMNATSAPADHRVAARMSRRLRLPADAGELAFALEQILRRILPGRRRQIRVGRGWYLLITDLDRKIAALDPAYQIFGVDAALLGHAAARV
jgi:hypothetical protein